jgi:hypothetical protein
MNTTEMTAGHRLREEALRLQGLEREPARTAARPSAEPPVAEEAPAIKRSPSLKELGLGEPRPDDRTAAAVSETDFALFPLVDKIAYSFASGLIVAMRELEAHIAGETQKVSASVGRHLGSLQASFQELTEELSEQRTLNTAVQEKCRALEAITVSLAQTDERQDGDLKAIRTDAAALSASVSERFDLASASLQDTEGRQNAQIAVLRDEGKQSATSLADRIAEATTALQEADARNAADVSSLRAETRESSTSLSERVQALGKDLMLQQDDLGAVKTTLASLDSRVDGFAERLDRQAEAFRSMFAAYSQRETQLEQMLDGLTRLRTYPPPPAAQL